MDLLHSLPTPKVIETLKTKSEGLSLSEADRRLKTVGKNQIIAQKKAGALLLFLKQFWNLMLLILAIACGLSFYFGELIDGIAIGVVILLNGVISFLQEYKAEKAVEALKKLMAPYALVRRGNQTLKIPAENIVPGDILILEEGMYITADARLLEVQELSTLEASLTGESNPVEKSIHTPKKISSLGDLCHTVFMGTVVSKGHGLAVVMRTGMQTEFGKIASLVQEHKEESTPLQKDLGRMIQKLALLVGTVIGFLFVLGYFQGRDLTELILTSISLGVSVIPEGLPTVITLTLAIGVQGMARERAIVKRLSAAETLGATSFICSDKTGTLTQNQMTVERLYLNGEVLRFQGNGYDPTEKLPVNSPELSALLTGAVLCNNATLFKNKTGWNITGDPTEGALLTLAKRGGLDRFEWEKKFPRKKEWVFDSDRKRMSTLHKNGLWCKGAPDSILSVCDSILIHGKVEKLSPKMRKEILKTNEDFAKEAYRVLAIAHKANPGQKPEEKGLTFIGLVGMMDPPRKEAGNAIRICHEAQIKVTMITGDHALTASAIGKSLGLFKENDLIMTGEELEKCSQKDLLKKVEHVRIFARVSPKHKVRILEALRSKGHVVAMTGDGINDAPALKKADIGVAMGITGTDVSKEASDLILTDDNFTTIVRAVGKGRLIYQNIKKSVRFLLSTNLGEILLVSTLFLLGEPAPFIPLQILWINLLTDTFPAIALGLDAEDSDLMKQKPRKRGESLWREIVDTSLISAVFFVVCAVVYFETHKEVPLHHLRTFMFTVTVIFQLFLVFSVRFQNRSFFHQFLSNPWLLGSIFFSVILQLVALYVPFFQTLLETEPLTGTEWLWLLGICTLATLAIEIWKLIQKRRFT